MNELLNQLLEKAKTNRQVLKHLTEAACAAQDYELSGKLRAMEAELYRDTPEQLAAKEVAGNLELVFRMVGLQSNEAGAWLAAETLKLYSKKKGKFDLLDAAKLQDKKTELFGE